MTAGAAGATLIAAAVWIVAESPRLWTNPQSPTPASGTGGKVL